MLKFCDDVLQVYLIRYCIEGNLFIQMYPVKVNVVEPNYCYFVELSLDI